MSHKTTYRALAAVLALALLAGCAGPFMPAEGRDPPVDSPAAGERRQEAVAAAWGVRGEGAETTDPFDMPAGTTEFQTIHEGSGDFTFELLDDAGTRVEELAAGSGNASATKEVVLTGAGTYRIRVTASAPWEINVTYPMP